MIGFADTTRPNQAMEHKETFNEKLWRFAVTTVLIGVAVIYIGDRNGWDKNGLLWRPFLSGPSKTQMRTALGVNWLEVIDRFPTVEGDRHKDRAFPTGTTLYPVRVKIKDSAYEGQKADTGWSDARLRAANFAPFDTLDLYFYKNDFGAWQVTNQR